MSSDHIITEHIRYLERVRNFRPRTLNKHKTVCGLWLNYLNNISLKLTEVSEDNLLSWITYRQREGVKDATISRDLCVLRTLYEYLFHFGKMPYNPAAALPSLMCRPPAEKEFLTVKECIQMLNAFNTDIDIELRNYIMVASLWCLGLRTSELSALNWQDINLEEGALLVRSGKGGKQRLLFLNDRLRDDIHLYRTRLGGADNSPVFFAFSQNASRKPKHARLSCSQLVDVIRLHAQKVGLNKSVNPLTFRHTFATHMYEAGVSMADLKEMMGHDTDTETTIYIHITILAIKRLLNNHIAYQTVNRGGTYL